MKPITLHPLSVLVGAALVGLSFALSGAAQAPTVTHHPRTEVVGQIPAEWWTYVELYLPQKPSYTVPADKWFVVTAAQLSGSIYADGVSRYGDLQPVNAYNTSFNGVPQATRAAFAPGTLLEPAAGSTCNLWGYLEPVR